RKRVIGSVGAGFLVLDDVMKWEIMCGFVVNLGEMQHRLERCVEYARTRRQFGVNIGANQSVANRIVEMKMDIESSRKWLYETAEKIMSSSDVAIDVALTKLMVSESNVRSALAAVDRTDEVAMACALYYAVRDGIRYDVYGADLTRRGLSAGGVLEQGFGFCVHKSIVYAAALRSVGIPSRLVYGDVRNHLASPRLRELVGGEIFRFHSLTSVHLNGTWVKATPVFNKMLCRLYRMKP